MGMGMSLILVWSQCILEPTPIPSFRNPTPNNPTSRVSSKWSLKWTACPRKVGIGRLMSFASFQGLINHCGWGWYSPKLILVAPASLPHHESLTTSIFKDYPRLCGYETWGSKGTTVLVSFCIPKYSKFQPVILGWIILSPIHLKKIVHQVVPFCSFCLLRKLCVKTSSSILGYLWISGWGTKILVLGPFHVERHLPPRQSRYLWWVEGFRPHRKCHKWPCHPCSLNHCSPPCQDQVGLIDWNWSWWKGSNLFLDDQLTVDQFVFDDFLNCCQGNG